MTPTIDPETGERISINPQTGERINNSSGTLPLNPLADFGQGVKNTLQSMIDTSNSARTNLKNYFLPPPNTSLGEKLGYLGNGVKQSGETFLNSIFAPAALVGGGLLNERIPGTANIPGTNNQNISAADMINSAYNYVARGGEMAKEASGNNPVVGTLADLSRQAMEIAPYALAAKMPMDEIRTIANPDYAKNLIRNTLVDTTKQTPGEIGQSLKDNIADTKGQFGNRFEDIEGQLANTGSKVGIKASNNINQWLQNTGVPFDKKGFNPDLMTGNEPMDAITSQNILDSARNIRNADTIGDLVNQRQNFDKLYNSAMFKNNIDTGGFYKQQVRSLINNTIADNINDPVLKEQYLGLNKDYAAYKNDMRILGLNSKNLDTISPEQFFPRILNKGSNGIEAAKNLAGEDALQAAAYKQLLNKSLDANGDFSANNFNEALKGIGEDRGRAVFNDDWQDIKDFGKSRVNQAVMEQTLKTAGWGAGAALAYHIPGFGPALTTLGGIEAIKNIFKQSNHNLTPILNNPEFKALIPLQIPAQQGIGTALGNAINQQIENQ